MKNTLIKASVLSVIFGLLLTTWLFAQTTPAAPATASKQAEPKKGETATHREETKDQWLKRYNDMKPKLDALSANAKMETKNPEFTTEANKLNTMATAYKAKIDQWDKTTPENKNAYMTELRKSDKALNEQYMKTKNMWSKMHPADDKKAAPQAAPAQQTPK